MSPRKSKSAFRTITEVADELGVAPYILRFWETKFPQIAPIKNTGGRRYYRPEDVELLRNIQDMLHNQRYTTEGVQRLIREKGVKALMGEEAMKDFFEVSEEVVLNEKSREMVVKLLKRLTAVKDDLQKALNEEE